MTVSEIIQSAHEDIDFSAGIIASSLKENRPDLLCLNVDWTVRCYLTLGLMHWRQGQDPRTYFNQMVKSAQNGMSALQTMDTHKNPEEQINLNKTIYSAYLLGLPHLPLSLDREDNNILARAFFGNVLIGAADIADWPKYRNGLPQGKRAELARRTNELYADLLAGRIAPDIGVKLGEKFWEERENNEWFLDGGEGGGDDNHRLVDYQLGAILKKIGSTVPTIHAWVW